ncbi:MAG TPA: NAD(P)-dependent oxidoreductase [Gemmataceae bacterium]|nr:NAD(P)-dependent oxidoreductase [Gemmataceae bacterium]
MEVRQVLITGATGNLGSKLRHHLGERYAQQLLDIDPRGDPAILQADLSHWDRGWVDRFQGVDVVVHLAANPTAHQSWPEVIGSNIDATIHVFQAAVQGGVKRVVYASSNHVMGGYHEKREPQRITTEIPPLPGTHYMVEGQARDSTPYAAAKLFGERLGKCYADTHGLSVIAVRIGWVRPGANRREDIPVERGPWFRLMWLSNRDFCHLMERCIVADLPCRFAVVNGMSANSGMRWDIETTRQLVGYEPCDTVD